MNEKKAFQNKEWLDLLFALTDPANMDRRDVEIAGECGLNKSSFKRILQDDDFRAALKEIAIKRAEVHIGKIMSSIITKAQRGNVQQQRLLLELMGLVAGKFEGGLEKGAPHEFNVGVPGIEGKTGEEVQEKLAALSRGDEDEPKSTEDRKPDE